MDYKEVVEWLKTYRDMYYRLTFVNNKIEGIKGINYSQDKSTGIHKTLNDYIEEKQILEDDMKKITEAIETVDNLKQKNVLKYKYLEFLSFEKIEEKMGYSVSSISNFHRRGIIKICKKIVGN